VLLEKLLISISDRLTSLRKNMLGFQMLLIVVMAYVVSEKIGSCPV
jgi:hypothetical protein